MAPFGTILDWIHWRRNPRLDSLRFEELQERYAEDQQGTYREFIRRLRPLVFYAAEHYLQSIGNAFTEIDVDNKVDEVFEDFSPEFDSGDPATLLQRFAGAIRRVLDDEAFRVIGPTFYRLLPIYNVPDAQQRRFLAAVYEQALSTPDDSVVESLATRMGVTSEEASEVLQRANKSVQKVMREDFSATELRDLTDGYLS